ncbi:hypothetical protein J6590_075672 [Homalodisca vitripennis]|nr:hypothetical protein J6590_075672 [Homalodisca vitripennis]
MEEDMHGHAWLVLPVGRVHQRTLGVTYHVNHSCKIRTTAGRAAQTTLDHLPFIVSQICGISLSCSNKNVSQPQLGQLQAELLKLLWTIPPFIASPIGRISLSCSNNNVSQLRLRMTDHVTHSCRMRTTADTTAKLLWTIPPFIASPIGIVLAKNDRLRDPLMLNGDNCRHNCSNYFGPFPREASHNNLSSTKLLLNVAIIRPLFTHATSSLNSKRDWKLLNTLYCVSQRVFHASTQNNVKDFSRQLYSAAEDSEGDHIAEWVALTRIFSDLEYCLTAHPRQ